MKIICAWLAAILNFIAPTIDEGSIQPLGLARNRGGTFAGRRDTFLVLNVPVFALRSVYKVFFDHGWSYGWRVLTAYVYAGRIGQGRVLLGVGYLLLPIGLQQQAPPLLFYSGSKPKPAEFRHPHRAHVRSWEDGA